MKDWKLLAQLIRERMDSSAQFTPPPGGWEELSERLNQAGPPSSASRIRDVMDESYQAAPPAAAWENMSNRLHEFDKGVPTKTPSFWKPLFRWTGSIAVACLAIFAVWNLVHESDVESSPQLVPSTMKQEPQKKNSGKGIENGINQPEDVQILTPSQPKASFQAGPNYRVENTKKVANSGNNLTKIDERIENSDDWSNLEEANPTLVNQELPAALELNRSEQRMRSYQYIRVPSFIKNQPRHSLSLKLKAQIWKNWANSQSNYMPAVGLQYRFMPTDVFGFETGLELSFQNGMDVVHELTQIDYGLTKQERLFTLEPKLGVFLDIPLRVTFQASARNAWSLGGRLQMLLDTKGTLTEFEVNDSMLNQTSSITQFGYKQGLNQLNFALELAYNLQLTEKFSIGSELIWGISDITSNDFFNMERNDYNRGININIIYNFFKVD